MSTALWSALLFIGLAIFLCGAAIIAGHIISPRFFSGEEQKEKFECGVDPIGTSWVKFKMSYFLYALIFLLFDIETVFLYPLAVVYRQIGIGPLIGVGIFILILIIGLWYEWKEGALEWK